MSRAKHGRSMLPEFAGALMNAYDDESLPQPGCLDQPDIFVDYEAKDLPTPEDAAYLCAPCPLRELCLENAKRVKPQWGVLGGAVWVRGRRIDSLNEEELKIRLDGSDLNV